MGTAMKESRTRWRRIDLTERQARAFHAALDRLLSTYEQALEMINMDDPLPLYTQRDLFELRRRLTVAGISPIDRWPLE